ncbi:lysophospholipid acyltransferase family protein [Oceanibium sediminis]|uniref:lysophospholipid acyltransferase family protein n=1 Tax=Oceanibium sediminis TaxID=2026339 RepID=UPI000DD4A1F7|nr:lysophospholipid acyltransferase family protein [Oceanibium sediminis]
MSGQSLIGDYLENLPLRIADQATRPLSPAARGAFAAWAARRIILNTPALRRRITDNLDHVWPDLPAAERARILHANAGNVGRVFFEMRRNTRIMAAAAAGEIPVTGDEGLAALRAAKADGRGALLVSGHYGQWDAARAGMKALGMETGGIFREHNNRFFNADQIPQFEACGKPLFPKGAKGMRAMIRHVSRGGFAAVMLDQKAFDGERIDFLGQPAWTATGLAALALKLKLPFVPAYGIRQPDQISFRVEVEPPIPHTDAVTMTRAANDSLAARVRECPEQWYWLHRRWAEPKDRRR